MKTSTRNNLILQSSFDIVEIVSFEMTVVENEHAKASFSATLNDSTGKNLISKSLKGNSVVFKNASDKKTVFAGILDAASIRVENDCYYLAATATSFSIMIDLEEKKRSFQDITATYSEVIKGTLKEYANTSVLLTVGKELPIGYPIIQFNETNWQFIKRLASHFNAPIIPDVESEEPNIWFGIRDSKTIHDFSGYKYSVNLDSKYYSLGGEYHLYKKSDFIYYTIETEENVRIGDKVSLNDEEWIICRKRCVLKDERLVFYYDIGNYPLIAQLKTFNEQISGASILGTILETKAETVKIHLDIDKSQDAATAYPYQWVPETGNMMYLMPKAGTKVALYFQNGDEAYARATSCIRTNGAGNCPAMAQNENRELLTEHDKRMVLYPAKAGFYGGEAPNITSNMIILDDEEGVVVSSKKSIVIMSEAEVLFEAPLITLLTTSSAGDDGNMNIGNIITAVYGGNVEALLSSSSGESATTIEPDSIFIIDLNGIYSYCVNNGSFILGEDFSAFAAFPCVMEKGSNAKLVGLCILGVLAGVIICAAIVVTGGAAIVAIGALAGAAAPIIGLSTIAFTAVTASVMTAFVLTRVAVQQYDMGNFDIWIYVKMGVAIGLSSLFCMAGGQLLGVVAGKIGSLAGKIVVRLAGGAIMGGGSNIISQLVMTGGVNDWDSVYASMATGAILTTVISLPGDINAAQQAANTALTISGTAAAQGGSAQAIQQSNAILQSMQNAGLGLVTGAAGYTFQTLFQNIFDGGGLTGFAEDFDFGELVFISIATATAVGAGTLAGSAVTKYEQGKALTQMLQANGSDSTVVFKMNGDVVIRNAQGVNAKMLHTNLTVELPYPSNSSMITNGGMGADSSRNVPVYVTGDKNIVFLFAMDSHGIALLGGFVPQANTANYSSFSTDLVLPIGNNLATISPSQLSLFNPKLLPPGFWNTAAGQSMAVMMINPFAMQSAVQNAMAGAKVPHIPSELTTYQGLSNQGGYNPKPTTYYGGKMGNEMTMSGGSRGGNSGGQPPQVGGAGGSGREIKDTLNDVTNSTLSFNDTIWNKAEYFEIKTALKSKVDKAFFWSGRTNGLGGAEIAEKIAKSKGGVTLESLVNESGINMPEWDFNRPNSIKMWEDASALYAEQVSGEIRAVVGKELREGNIWQNVELPRLKNNPRVTKITVIDPETQEETVIYIKGA